MLSKRRVNAEVLEQGRSIAASSLHDITTQRWAIDPKPPPVKSNRAPFVGMPQHCRRNMLHAFACVRAAGWFTLGKCLGRTKRNNGRRVLFSKPSTMDKQTAVEDLSASLIGATWTTAVLLEYLEGGVAIAGGAAIIWYNVEKALAVRKQRRGDVS